MRARLADLIPDKMDNLPWNPTSAIDSLDKYRDAVDEEAAQTIRWYYMRRHVPALAARIVRWLAIVTTAIGGLYPIWVRLLPGGSDGYQDMGSLAGHGRCSNRY